MSVTIRPLTEADLPQAARICRVAFGTFLGAPDPENFWADRDYVYGRFDAEHVASFAAEQDDELVGSNFATRWGSVAFFGPNTIRPQRQGPRRRQGPGRSSHQSIRPVGSSPRRSVHFSAESDAHRALWQIRVPRTVSHSNHGRPGGTALSHRPAGGLVPPRAGAWPARGKGLYPYGYAQAAQLLARLCSAPCDAACWQSSPTRR